MTDYDETNRGVLFKNDKREKDTHPHFTGKINIDGVEYWLSAWTKEGKSGKFFSLSAKAKEDAPKASKPAPAPVAADPFDDFSF